ncbi:B-cell scaffold protein with ankyrin repeats-like [Oncorhynchus nerka]|uniref:B-cell scaffold protein with ankyrin repeats-like n=1 Tax=Oncorhynchus nerka TaxID=8023 RepID=UPI0031B7F660
MGFIPTLYLHRTTVTCLREDLLQLGRYKVKLLILSRSMLKGLSQLRHFFLARVLNPAVHVVVVLCGVDSLAPLLEVVALKGDECLQISSEKDAHDYLSEVTDIVQRGHQAAAGNISDTPGKLTGPALNLKLESRQSTGTSSIKPNNMRVVPSRVPCGVLQVSLVEKLDQRLFSMLLKAMPSAGFQGLQGDDPPEGELHLEDISSLLHFAAQNGFKDVSSVLLQCPGPKRASCTATRQCNRQMPAEIAQHHDHAEVRALLQQTLNMFTVDKDSDDTSVNKMMCTAGNNISSMYDTFVPNQPLGLELLSELQEKRGSLSRAAE